MSMLVGWWSGPINESGLLHKSTLTISPVLLVCSSIKLIEYAIPATLSVTKIWVTSILTVFFKTWSTGFVESC